MGDSGARKKEIYTYEAPWVSSIGTMFDGYFQPYHSSLSAIFLFILFVMDP